MTPDRSHALHSAAIKLATERGLANVTMQDVCSAADTPVGSFQACVGVPFTTFLLDLVDSGLVGAARPIERKRAAPRIVRAHMIDVAVVMVRDSSALPTLAILAQRANVSQRMASNLFRGGQRTLDRHVRKAVKARA